MNKKLFIVALAVLFSIGLVNMGYCEDSILLGRVSLVYGEAKIQDPTNGESEQIVMGTEIRTGNIVEIPKNSKLEVCYLDGAVIRFKENSKVQFRLDSLQLFNGKVWLRVMKSGKKFEVVTPTFVAGVRGTVFTVEAGRNTKGHVGVYEGTVYSKTKQATVDVEKGNTVSIAPTGDISEPRKLESDKDKDFEEPDWQAIDRNMAYQRYMMLLMKGIDAADLDSGAAESELKDRAKLPEVQYSKWTYESFVK